MRIIRTGKGHPITGHQGPRGGVQVLILNLGDRRGWVVSTTPRPLYPRERPGTHCTGGWVGPRAGLYVCKNYHPIMIRSPDPLTLCQSLYRLSYPAHIHMGENIKRTSTKSRLGCLPHSFFPHPSFMTKHLSLFDC
jgi:hypothetical protein